MPDLTEPEVIAELKDGWTLRSEPRAPVVQYEHTVIATDPGDTLRVESEIIEKRRSKSRPEMGIFKSRAQVFNQNDEIVLEMTSNGLISVREPDAPILG